MFGQSTPFGAASTSNTGFGQSTFGKPAGFSAPVFGGGNPSLFNPTPAQPQTGGLFGSSATTPAFGQPQTTQSPFGQTSGFGSIFGQQQNAATSATTGSLFGTQPNTAASSTSGAFFGSNNTSAFGQSKPFSFGTSTGLFGQNQQPAQQQTSLFGQPAAQTAGLFGASSSTNIVGTPIKFNPVTGNDSMVKNGVTTPINTRHYCITCMKEYEAKSLEELRLEDYMLNRKGGQQGNTPSLFGSTAQPSLFGGASTSTSTGAGMFGSTENKPLFGGTTSSIGTFGSTSGGGLFSSNTGGTDLFGKNQSAPAFGTPAATQSTAFGFNAPTTSNMFGTNTAQVRPFGATTQAPSLFGSTPQQPALGFGTATSSFGAFGTQNQGGLFSQNKPAFGLGTTTATGFSFGSNTATNTSAFGAKLGAPFGSTPASTGSTFGSNMFNSTATTQPTSGLFGSTLKPAATTFSFGQTPTTSTSLGGGLNLGGSNMFGNNAAKPGGLFGSTTNTGSLFGGNTFGGGLSSGFGTGTNTGLGSSLPFGSSTLGSTGTNLNQSQNTTVNGNVNQQILALASMPFGDTPLFKNLLPVTGKADTLLKSAPKTKSLFSEKDYKVSPRQSPSIKVRPVNRSDFSKKSLFDGLEDIKDQQGSLLTKSNPKALVLPSKDFNSPNKKTNDDEVTVQLEPPIIISKFGKSSPTDSDTSLSNIKKSMISCAIQTPSRNEDFTVRNGETDRSDSSFTKNDPNTSSSPAVNNTMAELLPQKSSSSGKKSPAVVDISNRDVGNESDVEIRRRSLNEQSTSSSSKGNEADVSESAPHPTGIILHRVGYYTIPSLDELTAFIDRDGKCLVENFTVGRRNYGNIFYPDSLDVAGLDIDSIVHIRHKEVVVYPDDSVKPPVGEGLNRKAQITLDRVWPTDKSTHQPISDPVRLTQLDYEGKLRRACAKLKTRFVDYRPQTGSWVFKVDHFSKYGLSDSDDEEEDQTSDIKKLKTSAALPPSIAKQAHRSGGNSHLKKQMQMPSHYDLLEPNEDHHMLDENDSMTLKQNFEFDEMVPVMSHEKTHKSPTSELARNLGTSSHKVQLMKASFYLNQEDDDAYSMDSDYMDFTNMPPSRIIDLAEMDQSRREMARLTAKAYPVFRTQFVQQPILPAPTSLSIGSGDPDSSLRTKVTSTTKLFMPQPIVAGPQRVHLKYPNSTVPFHLSSVARIKAKCTSDMSLFMGRSFRVGWAKELNFVHLTTDKLAESFEKHNNLDQVGNLLNGRPRSDFSKTIVQQLKITSPSPSQTFKDLIQSHMNVRLKYSMKDEEDDCPVFSPVSGVEALHAHSLIADQQSENYSFTKYIASVWQLCVALWGNLPDLAAKDDERDHASLMARRHAFSEWLQSVVHPSVKRVTVDEQQVSSVFHLLTGNKILEACEMAISQGDYNLSLLIAQVGSNIAVRTLASKQLMQWRDTEADKLIDENRIKLMMCTAGIPLFESSFGVINVCQNLDWKRALGVHFWYLGSPADSITDALLAYEKAFNREESYAEKPSPHYSDGELDYEIVRGKEFSDICFHILKLYSQRSHPLESLLNPATYTPDPFDYSLSWLLLETLESLGYRHLSEFSAAQIHVSFAMQLEGHGLWQWAIFVLLHLKNVQRRRQAVLDVIGKHVTLSEDGTTTLTETEIFVHDTLGVPIEWIYDAKATVALSFHRYKEAAWYLIKSGQWSKSHQIIMQHLAADAIINENYDNLEALLSQLSSNSVNISGWHHFGSVLCDYLTCVREVNHLIATQDSSVAYQLEKLQPQISSICSRVKHLPTSSAKDRLMRAEIAKRTAHIVRSILILQSGDIGASSHILASLIAQLPLPEDYEQQEIQQIIAPLVDNFSNL